jgi:hypothetical protein
MIQSNVIVFLAHRLAFPVCPDVKALCCKWLLLNYVTGKQQKEVTGVNMAATLQYHTCIILAKAKCRSGIWYYMVCGKPNSDDVKANREMKGNVLLKSSVNCPQS